MPAKLPVGRIPSFEVGFSQNPKAPLFSSLPDMHSSTQLVIVVTTVTSHHDAEQLASQLLHAGLAACIQIDGPVTSHYQWDGAIQSSTEYRLMIKTGNACWQDLKEQLTALHPYEEPEILMLPVSDTTEGYLNWVIQHTR